MPDTWCRSTRHPTQHGEAHIEHAFGLPTPKGDPIGQDLLSNTAWRCVGDQIGLQIGKKRKPVPTLASIFDALASQFGPTQRAAPKSGAPASLVLEYATACPSFSLLVASDFGCGAALAMLLNRSLAAWRRPAKTPSTDLHGAFRARTRFDQRIIIT